MNKQRVAWVDMAKGLGICMVIYGHIATDALTIWIYTFHVPLFFFLSGYFFDPNKKTTEFILSKVKGLLLPYLTLGIPLLLINAGYGIEPKRILLGYIIQERASTLWFLAALFMQMIIAFFLYRTIPNFKIRWCIVGLLAISALVMWHCDVLALPWNIDVSMITLPFFCIGYRLKAHADLNRYFTFPKVVKYIGILGGVSIVGTIIMYEIPLPTVDLCASHFSFEPIAYITAFCGILAICLFAGRFYSNIISYIGQHSLVYFVWQQDIGIMIITKILHRFHFLEDVTGIILFIKNITVVIAVITFLTILNEIIMKTKIRILIGK